MIELPPERIRELLSDAKPDAIRGIREVIAESDIYVSVKGKNACAGEVGRRRLRTTVGAKLLPDSNLLGCISPHFGLLAALVVLKWGEKWAGADSNCGYGHPKAEGYQATPPARTRRKDAVSFNASESTDEVEFPSSRTRYVSPHGDDQ